jgi:hypothetical protein
MPMLVIKRAGGRNFFHSLCKRPPVQRVGLVRDQYGANHSKSGLHDRVDPAPY